MFGVNPNKFRRVKNTLSITYNMKRNQIKLIIIIGMLSGLAICGVVLKAIHQIKAPISTPASYMENR